MAKESLVSSASHEAISAAKSCMDGSPGPQKTASEFSFSYISRFRSRSVAPPSKITYSDGSFRSSVIVSRVLLNVKLLYFHRRHKGGVHSKDFPR